MDKPGMANRYSDTEIAQMFSDYVTRMEDRPRHTGAAIKEADAFNLFCESEFPMNVRLQTQLFERMMNTAIEYEESGFLAGFKTAMALMTGDDEFLPCQTKAGGAQERGFASAPNNPSNGEEKRKRAAVTDVKPGKQCQGTPEKYIDTTQIAKMLGRTNWKTCRTINNSIIPFLTEEEKKEFVLDNKRDRRKKEQVIYKLTLSGCRKFIELCESPQFSVYANFLAGAELLKQEMRKVWCSECEANAV